MLDFNWISKLGSYNSGLSMIFDSIHKYIFSVYAEHTICVCFVISVLFATSYIYFMSTISLFSSVGSGQDLHASGLGSIPGRGTFPCGNLSWNLFYSNLSPTSVSSREVVSNSHWNVFRALVIKLGSAKQTQGTSPLVL